MPRMDERFRQVSTGLTLVLASSLLLALPLFRSLGAIVTWSPGGAGNLILWNLQLLQQSMIAMVGMIHCLRLPEKARATRRISVATGLLAAFLASSLAITNVWEPWSLPGWTYYMAGVGLFLWLASNVVFASFLVRLADFLDGAAPRGKARLVVSGSVLACGLTILFIPVLLAFGLVAILLLPALAIVWLVLLVLYLVVIFQVKQALDRQLAGQAVE